MNDATDLLGPVESVILALTRSDVPYFVTGSFASSLHGEFRATNDLDIVAALETAILVPLFDALSRDFVTDIDQAHDALHSQSSFNIIHRSTYLKVDVFPCVTDFDREALRRAELVMFPGAALAVRIATREDILLAKLRWYRLGGEASRVQWRDAERLVLLNREELDDRYLHAWAERLGVRDLLRRMLSPG